ncbi:unnamed protein product [Lymnaea stagnalis]|uniref:Ig-like domain-containing protein n=1 Tax=Lymnaea stagnalis TaxID=6523 RepID=A0AAV2HME9_LYMST
MAFSELTLALIQFILLESFFIERTACRFSVVAGVEGAPVTVTIDLPMSDAVNTVSLITIMLEDHNTRKKEDVFYIFVKELTFKRQLRFLALDIVRSLRTFELRFTNTTPDLAGTFGCYQGTGESHRVADCGQLLIVLRKPMKPMVEALKKPALSKTLELICHTQSASLPHDHNLGPLVRWHRPAIHDEWQVGRIRTSKDGHLLLDHLSQDDFDLGFACSFSDNATVPAPQSDPSDPYYIVIAEADEGSAPGGSGKPFYSHVYITSHVLDASVVKAALGDELKYKCNVKCTPACEASWSFLSKTHAHKNYQPVKDLTFPDELMLKVKKEDEGTYRCTASNPEGRAYATFHLNIHP